MTTFPRSPRTIRGAIVGFDIFNPIASVIIFQYNPTTVTRSLQAQAAGDNSSPAEALRLHGAPVETIRMDVEIDATDQLEVSNNQALDMGIYPQLSALEMLVYPKSSVVIANTALTLAGVIEIIPTTAPFTLLIWGIKRILPVRVNDFSITEEAHDTNLNPIRAKVTLGMRVLSYSDLPVTHPGHHLFLAHQIVKETMATLGSVNDISAVAGGDINLI